MLVRKTHQSIVLGSITFPRDNLQLNLTCFNMIVKKDFATAWMLVGGQWFYRNSNTLTKEKNTCIC